jgi:hypothetical protein
MPAGNVAVTPVYQYTGGGSSSTDASLSPTAAVFNKDPRSTNYKDVTVTLNPGDYSLMAVRVGGAALAAGTDYTVNGNVITVKKEYLVTLGLGYQAVTFDMTGGTDPVLAVTITDTRSVLYPVIEHFDTFMGVGISDAKIQADHTKFVRLLYKGVEVDSKNYTVTQGSTVITLKESYLKTFANGTHWFIAEYTDGISENIRLVVNRAGLSLPDTGDGNNPALWLSLMGAGMLGVAVCAFTYRKSRRQSRKIRGRAVR